MSQHSELRNPWRQRIDRGFEAWARQVCRYPGWVIAASALVTVLLAAQVPSLRGDFSTKGFLQPGDPSMTLYAEFLDQFERDESVVVALSPEDIFDPAFLERLRALHLELEEQVPYVDEVTSLVNARWTRGEGDTLRVDDLMEDWPETPEELAALRARALANPTYRGSILSRDARLTTVVVRPQVYSSAVDEGVVGFEEEGGEPELISSGELEELADAVGAIAARYQAPDFPVHVVGEPVMSTYMNRTSQADTGVFTSLSIVLMGALLYALFRRVSAVVLSLLVIIASIVASFGWMALLDVPFSTPTQVLPSLILAVGICDAVHVLTIVYQGLAEGRGRADAIVYALRHSGLAVAMTSLTTVGGLLSFLGAEIRPISNLGIIAPIGILTALFYTFTLLPALLAVWPLAPARPLRLTEVLQRRVASMGRFAMHRPRLVLALTAGVLVVSLVGASQLRFGLHTLHWIPEDDPIRVATELIDEGLEGSGRVEIVIDTGRESGLFDPDVLARVDASVQHVESMEVGPVRVGNALSVVDLVKETHQALHGDDPAYYALPSDRATIAQELLLFENSGWDDLAKFTTPAFDRARVSVPINLVDAIAYPPFLRQLERDVAGILGDELGFYVTGANTLVSRTFEHVMHSLARSYALALAIIAPLLALMIGSLRRGLTALIPNLLPVVFVLGCMGFADIALNPPTLLMGAIVIGLAVDDTIHFMHKYAGYRAEGCDAYEAVDRTLATTGAALLVTSMALCGSFLVFQAGYMDVLKHVGAIVSLGCAAAFLADVWVAPALIALVPDRAPARGAVGPLGLGALEDAS